MCCGLIKTFFCVDIFIVENYKNLKQN